MGILQDKLIEVNSFTDLFKLLKESINKNLHVSTLALYKEQIKEFDESVGYGIIKVAPIPLQEKQSEYTINAYTLNNNVYNENDILIIIYTDCGFVDNLNENRYLQRKNLLPQYHSQMNAVVIGLSTGLNEGVTDVKVDGESVVIDNIANITTIDMLKNISGYDGTKTQVLKNIAGTFTWVDEV